MAIKTELRDIKMEPMDDYPDVDIPNSSDYDEGIPLQSVIQNIKTENLVKYFVHYLVQYIYIYKK